MTKTNICPTCRSEGERSTVTPGSTTSTLMGYSPGYFDEDGEWVANRDPNWRTTSYHCSRGHFFDIVRREGDPDVVRSGDDAGKGPTFRAND